MVENVRPFGNEGEMDQEVTVPPLTVGVAVVMAVPLFRVNGLPLYAMELGAASFTVIDTLAVELPPVLVAVTVYVAVEVILVGVPEIAPLVVENDSPAGSEGEMDQEVTVPPLTVGVAVVMATPLVSVNGVPLYTRE